MVLTKHKIIGFDFGFIDFNYIKLVYKCLNNHVSPMFSELLSRRQSSHRANTRATVRGDCLDPKCKTFFGQSAFSVKGLKLWNALPTNLKKFKCERIQAHLLQLSLWAKWRHHLVKAWNARGNRICKFRDVRCPDI